MAFLGRVFGDRLPGSKRVAFYFWFLSSKILNKLQYTLAGNVVVKFFDVADQHFEVIDVPGLGNCFYEMIRLGLAFNKKFHNVQRIKDTIFNRMSTLWDAKESWVLRLF